MADRSLRCLACGAASLAAALAAGPVPAQAPPAEVVLDTVVVSASRREERTLDVPASIDIIDGSVIRDGRPMVNLSETLVRVPGIVANNRQNYAQDLQISSRGFGSRAAFGVRGLRLWQDDIPQTMPDGQGQTGSFLLLATDRIEVLRGPYSVRFGNASGGTISVITEGAPAEPAVTLDGGVGSDDMRTLMAKAAGRFGGGHQLVGAASHFATDGYRDHSEARRDLAVLKWQGPVTESTEVTFLATWQDQPESQDPLGLTRAQWGSDPRMADPVATLFDTRKTVRQTQAGARLVHRFDADTRLVATAYGGRRQIEQFLAFTGAAATSSGGVVDLDRDYAGVSTRFEHHLAAPVPMVLTAGVEYEDQDERRRGYVNDFGVAGDLRRDEDDTVRSISAYAELVAWVTPQVSLTAGVRSGEVRFEVDDRYVTPANPDDSGRRTFRATTPVLAALYRPTAHAAFYVSYGEGFETPTLAELAYSREGPGFNRSLDSSTSRNTEIGFKYRVTDRQRFEVALFNIDTRDEIVVDTAVGGRTIYRNAGRTRRQGVEIGYDGRFGEEWFVHANASWLDATFRDGFASGTPPVEVSPGNRLPGVPSRSAYAELVWRPVAFRWLELGAEVQHAGKVYVNDRNSDAAPSWTVAALRAVLRWQVGAAELSAFARVDNLGNERYAGSVIVGDANGRFFEPAPGRTWFTGARARIVF